MYIKYTIKTNYSIEEYFLEIDERCTWKNIEAQIDYSLRSQAFEEEYKLVEWKEVSERYVKARQKLIKLYNEIFEVPVDEAFFGGEENVTLESIISGMDWQVVNNGIYRCICNGKECIKAKPVDMLGNYPESDENGEWKICKDCKNNNCPGKCHGWKFGIYKETEIQNEKVI